ncbi:hypothetical protein SS50377_22422 [Spironucleus salmonicida]|uniref:Uncharacterized protein n=1 Tax=Spironucleus salmonicida TaxID=348837 RepID=V6LC92_9EUKA|nr:hypothetical protein SS50377_22422 [Spironucleus salmonicida]|eukprot:EST42087.1 Hypothetical protein SS50377_18394 [Spironucleus salmonicida]
MSYSQKYVLDDISTLTNQKFPACLTRYNFETDEDYQKYFDLLNDALIEINSDQGTSRKAEIFRKLKDLLESQVKLGPDPILLKVDQYTTDHLLQIDQFLVKYFQIDNIDEIQVKEEENQEIIDEDQIFQMGTLAQQRQTAFENYQKQHQQNIQFQADKPQHLGGKEYSRWWIEQDFDF